MTFALFTVPTFEVIESSFVDAVLRKAVAAQLYEDWRRRGAQEGEARKLFADADKEQRRNPAFAEELARIEALERLFAEGASTDPLIAGTLEVPLSTGEKALFVIDDRHRLLAAAATDVGQLEVYIGTPTPA